MTPNFYGSKKQTRQKHLECPLRRIHIHILTRKSSITKRQVLLSVAKLLDPARWLVPIVIRAKILMQRL